LRTRETSRLIGTRATLLQRLAIAAVLTVASLAVVGCSKPEPRSGEAPTDEIAETSASNETVEVHVAAWNDFHGHLESPAGTVPTDDGEVRAGGAALLAGWLDEFRAEHAHTSSVVAGDLIGASPLISALYHDEPTVEVMNEIGLDAVAVGNHEFDEGWRELLRIAGGGCHPEDGCREGTTYAGADFPYLAANVYRENGERLFDPYIVREFDGVQVAFVGMALDDVPSIVVPSSIEGLTFENEVETLEKIVPELRDRAVEAIVALIHEGGIPKDPSVVDVDACPGLEGPIDEIVRRSPDAVDAFVTGHTHHAYICRVDGRLVTSAMSKGRIVTDLSLTVHAESGDVSEVSADNHILRTDGPKSEKIAELVGEFETRAERKAEEPVGRVASPLSREPDDDGEMELGSVIADAQLAATRSDETGGAQFALMNPGGIRGSLKGSADGEGGGPVTYGDLHAVQPFRNQVLVVTLTGCQLHEILEAQWRERDHATILQVSRGLRYTWHPDRPPGDRVDPEDVEIRGQSLDLEAEYRVAVNNFLAEGGDEFSTFTERTDTFYGPLDIKALRMYIEEHSPVAPPDGDRIRRAPANTSE